jgi:hypothetical protein
MRLARRILFHKILKVMPFLFQEPLTPTSSVAEDISNRVAATHIDCIVELANGTEIYCKSRRPCVSQNRTHAGVARGPMPFPRHRKTGFRMVARALGKWQFQRRGDAKSLTSQP